MYVSEPSSTVILGPPSCARNCWALNTSSSWIVILPAYFPCWTMSVTTCTFRGVAFWPRVPDVPHWLRSPVSKSALKMISAEAQPMAKKRPADRIKSGEYLIRAVDVISNSPAGRCPSSQDVIEVPSFSADRARLAGYLDRGFAPPLGIHEALPPCHHGSREGCHS